ncbi:MAG: PLDc N-terminal domain-containing protein, partial [Gemmatimonadales bacterium]|nr:PLDc N-terminal domain-containing protein [Gemmatimonadales bacterium]
MTPVDPDPVLAAALRWWPVLTGITGVVLASLATVHIVLHKRDVRAAIGWTGLAWLAPIAGPLLYLFLGVNRIRRRAGRLRGRPAPMDFTREMMAARQELAVLPPGLPSRLASIATVVGTTTGQPLVAGNVVEPLLDGDEAYPAMLEAIDAAERSIGLATYIFDTDRAGARFVEALARAADRGVAVRVL